MITLLMTPPRNNLQKTSLGTTTTIDEVITLLQLMAQAFPKKSVFTDSAQLVRPCSTMEVHGHLP